MGLPPPRAEPLHRWARSAAADGERPPLKAEYLHLTLAFLGDLSPHLLAGLKLRLGRVESRPFSLVFGGLGARPGGVLWLAVKPSEPLLELRRKVAKACSVEAGARFLPHITLLRAKKPISKSGRPPLPPLAAVEVRGFELMTSETRPEGAQYRVVREYRF